MSKITTLQENIEIIYGAALTDSEKEEYDYLETEELESSQFFRYKDDVFWLGNFMRHEAKSGDELEGWHGVYGTSHFHAYIIKLLEDGESVTLGQHTA